MQLKLPVYLMELTFDHADCFKRDGGDIWRLGLAENKALLTLHSALSRGLTAGGFTLENRRFSPHITLAREVRLLTPPDRESLLGAPFSIRADAVSLMCSEQIGGKLIYTQQYTIQVKR